MKMRHKKRNTSAVHRRSNAKTWRTEIRKALEHPTGFAELLRDHRLSTKFKRVADRHHRAAVAFSYAVMVELDECEHAEHILIGLREQQGRRNSSDPILLVLRAVIDYEGSEHRQYASRDKAVVSLLRLRAVPVEKAVGYIKHNGGLVACAAEFRRVNRGERAPDKGNGAPKRSLASLFPEPVGDEGAVALAVLEARHGKRVTIAGSTPLPVPDDEAERGRVLRWVEALAYAIAEVQKER